MLATVSAFQGEGGGNKSPELHFRVDNVKTGAVTSGIHSTSQSRPQSRKHSSTETNSRSIKLYTDRRNLSLASTDKCSFFSPSLQAMYLKTPFAVYSGL